MTALVMDIFKKLYVPHFSVRWFSSLEPMYRFIAKCIAIAIYNPTYTGFEQIPEKGAAILIANHVSYVDGLIIAVGCKRPVRFIIDTNIYNLPLVHYFMQCNKAIPILPTRESVTHALEEISAGLKAGDLICIFPEGQMTYTGSLGRFKTGIESIIKRDPVPVYPIALTGLWGSVFSRKYLGSLRRYIPMSRKQRVHVLCGAPLAPEHVKINRLQETVLRLKYIANNA